jgi:hypothetical protein
MQVRSNRVTSLLHEVTCIVPERVRKAVLVRR